MALDIPALFNDIETVLNEKMPDALAEFERARRVAFETRYEDEPLPDWNAKRYFLFSMHLRVMDNYIEFEAKAFDWGYKTAVEGVRPNFMAALKSETDVKALTAAQKQQLFGAWASYVESLVLADDKDIFAPLVEAELSFVPHNPSVGVIQPGELFKTIEKPNADAYRRELREYAERMMRGEDDPCTNLYRVLLAVERQVYNSNWAEFERFVASFYKNVRGMHMGRECREHVYDYLKDYCWFLLARNGIARNGSQKSDFGAFTPDEKALLLFTVDMINERAEDQYALKTGRYFAKIAEKGETKSPETQPLPSSESAMDEPPAEPDDVESDDETLDIFLKQSQDGAALVCGYYEDGREAYFSEAFENRGWVNCEISSETEAAYKVAIEFLCKIIEDGFPPRFDFAFESSKENAVALLDKQRIVLSDEPASQFAANCAQYPALHEDMRRYARAAAESVEFLASDEIEDDEAYRRVDFFVASALTLLDASGKDFCDCLGGYADSIGIGEGSAILSYAVSSYLDKYGVTNENAANLAAATETSYEFCDVISDYFRYLPDEQRDAAIDKILADGEADGLELEDFKDMVDAMRS